MSKKTASKEEKWSGKSARALFKKFREKVAKRKYAERHERAMSFIFSKEDNDIDNMINATKRAFDLR